MEKYLNTCHQKLKFAERVYQAKYILIIVFLLCLRYTEAQVPLGQTGMVSIFQADPSIETDIQNNMDVTVKLTNAIQSIIDKNGHNRTAYIPSGTYRVSNTMIIETQKHRNSLGDCADQSGDGAAMVYGDPVDPPVIKLIDGSITQAGPVPVLKIWRRNYYRNDPQGDNQNCLFYSSVRNLKFDLGNNPGACGVLFGAAQDAEMSNIEVFGNDFHSGFMGVPARNAAVVNLRVYGGKYGLFFPHSAGCVGYTLTGLTLHGQSLNAIYLQGGDGRGGAMVGLDIRDCGGTAIRVSTANVDAGHLTVVDSRIEVNSASSFAFDRAERILSLVNVYIKGTSNIVKGSNQNFTVSSSAGNWTHMESYNYTPGTIASGYSGFTMMNGVKAGGGQELADTMLNSPEPPANLQSRHLPTSPPEFNNGNNWLFSFKTPGAINFLDFKTAGNSHTDALEAALNSSARVIYIPAAASPYVLDRLITIPAGKVLVGDPGLKSRFAPDHSIINPNSRCWIFTTDNTNGFNAIQDIGTDPENKAFIGSIHWRNKEGFIYRVRNHYSSGHGEQDKHNFAFSGNAGGKVYGLGEHKNLEGCKNAQECAEKNQVQKVANPNFRKVYVNGTSNPLTFYGLNLERGGITNTALQYPFFEAVDSRNIQCFGTKSETNGLVYRFDNSSNFFVSNLFAHQLSNPVPLIEVTATCNHFILSVIGPPKGSGDGSDAISDGAVMASSRIKKPQYTGWYSKGSFNHSVFSGGIGTSVITSQELPPVTLYPNPVDNLVWVTLPKEVRNAVGKILSVDGKVMKHFVINGSSGTIPLEGLKSPGLYLVQVPLDHNTVTVKMVLK